MLSYFSKYVMTYLLVLRQSIYPAMSSNWLEQNFCSIEASVSQRFVKLVPICQKPSFPLLPTEGTFGYCGGTEKPSLTSRLPILRHTPFPAWYRVMLLLSSCFSFHRQPGPRWVHFFPSLLWTLLDTSEYFLPFNYSKNPSLNHTTELWFGQFLSCILWITVSAHWKGQFSLHP